MNSKEVASLLLKIKAVALNTQQPFRYTSGILSPVYCDNRLIISTTKERKQIIDALLQKIDSDVEVIAGVATAGIPHAAWIADRLNKPMVYVRSKAKGHGRQNQIEGRLPEKTTALVIEDLISTGGSSIEAANVLRDAGATVTTCLAIFTYQLNTSIDGFKKSNLKLETLSNFTDLADVAIKDGYISEDEKTILQNWQKDPTHWKP